MNQYIAFALLIWVWVCLLTGFMSYEKWKKRQSRERFDRAMARWWANGGVR